MPLPRPSRGQLAALLLMLLPGASQAAGVLQFLTPRLAVTEGQDTTITVIRTGSDAGEVTVTLNVAAGGTADAGADFDLDLPLGVVRLPAGQLYARVSLALPDDEDVEGTEFVTFSLANPTGATLARNDTLLLQIQDDETPAASIRIGGEAVRRVTEGDALALALTREGLTGTALEVDTLGVPGTAGLGIDYTDLSATLEFAADATSATTELLTIEDSEPEPPESLSILLADALPAGQAAFVGLGPEVIIEDDEPDRPGEFRIFANDTDVAEDAGTVTLTVDRNRGSAGSASVSWSTVPGEGSNDARPGEDFESATGTLQFVAGETRKTFTVEILDDQEADQDNRRFLVVLGNPTDRAGIDPEGRSVTLSIQENDGIVDDDECWGFCDCFIATAAYGSWMHPHVKSLRHFRDSTLVHVPQGRAFIALYYRFSPPIADYIRQRPALRTAVRAALAPVVFGITHPGLAAGALLVVAVGGLSLRRSRRGIRTS